MFLDAVRKSTHLVECGALFSTSFSKTVTVLGIQLVDRNITRTSTGFQKDPIN